MSAENGSNGNGSKTLLMTVFGALVVAGAVAWAGTGTRALEKSTAVESAQKLLELRVGILEKAMGELKGTMAEAAASATLAASRSEKILEAMERRERRERGRDGQ